MLHLMSHHGFLTVNVGTIMFACCIIQSSPCNGGGTPSHLQYAPHTHEGHVAPPAQFSYDMFTNLYTLPLVSAPAPSYSHFSGFLPSQYTPKSSSLQQVDDQRQPNNPDAAAIRVMSRSRIALWNTISRQASRFTNIWRPVWTITTGLSDDNKPKFGLHRQAI